MCSKWITFRIKTVHVVIHKCVLFLNFEFEKKKNGGRVVFSRKNGGFKKKNSLIQNFCTFSFLTFYYGCVLHY